MTPENKKKGKDKSTERSIYLQLHTCKLECMETHPQERKLAESDVYGEPVFSNTFAATDRMQTTLYTSFMGWNCRSPRTEVYSYNAGSVAGALWWIWRDAPLTSDSTVTSLQD